MWEGGSYKSWGLDTALQRTEEKEQGQNWPDDRQQGAEDKVKIQPYVLMLRGLLLRNSSVRLEG